MCELSCKLLYPVTFNTTIIINQKKKDKNLNNKSPVQKTTKNNIDKILNECSPNPCLNRGTCITFTNGRFYKCFCKSGFSGSHCQNVPSMSLLFFFFFYFYLLCSLLLV